LYAALDLRFAISRRLNRADAITCLMHISAHWNFAQAPSAPPSQLPGALGGRRRLENAYFSARVSMFFPCSQLYSPTSPAARQRSLITTQPAVACTDRRQR
jgi:hypothetical protein